MTTALMHIPVADPTGTPWAATSKGVAFPSTGNPHESATPANQAARRHEAQPPILSLHFWIDPSIVDC
jgi:hypothetical protein